MNFSFFIACRYILPRKGQGVVHLVSFVSMCGVSLATMALVCTLSVFNGFQDLMSSLFTEFDPQLKILPKEGKWLNEADHRWEKLQTLKEVKGVCKVYEDMALARYDGKQKIVKIKGVDEHFEEVSGIENILYGNGRFVLNADVIDYGVVGLGVAVGLGTGVSFSTPIQVYAPHGGEQVDMLNPSQSFQREELYSPGLIFNVGQKSIDDKYIITSLGFAKKLFDRKGVISAVEIGVKDGANVDALKERLRKEMGKDVKILSREEQQEDLFRVMNIEKMISFVFLLFISLVACFNIIGSLSMLILNKRKDVSILSCLGANRGQITGIFVREGIMIVLTGAASGVVLGVLMCVLQENYGLLKMGEMAGSFIVDAYPVSMHAVDILLVFTTVLVAGVVSILFPLRRLVRTLLY